jgi:hypothetical protein
MAIARLRRIAIILGALPERTWERSSSKVTSRTQWLRFSMDQCPRTSWRRSAGDADSGDRLVMIATCSWRVFPVLTSVVIRSIRATCPQ